MTSKQGQKVLLADPSEHAKMTEVQKSSLVSRSSETLTIKKKSSKKDRNDMLVVFNCLPIEWRHLNFLLFDYTVTTA